MSIKVQQTKDGNIAIGDVLTEAQKKALNSIAPTADEILEQQAKLNQEIAQLLLVQLQFQI